MLKDTLSNLLTMQRISKLKVLLCFCLFVGTNTILAQQEPMFSQYMFNLSHINPAYAGNRATNNVTALFRKQWMGIDGAPTTGSLSWDTRKEDSNIGYGLEIYSDKLGIESTSGVQAFYTYRIPMKSSTLAFGLSAGALNYKATFSQVGTVQGGDPVFQEDVNGVLPTVGLGILYSTEKWYAGLSSPALLETKINTHNTQVTKSANNHYFLTGGYIFDLSDAVKIKPSVLLKAVKGAPLEYDFNMNAWIQNSVGLGVSYRTNDALIGMFELQVSPMLRIGYAYDYTISRLKTFSKGTHELMLRYEFNNDKNKRVLSPRYY